MMNAVVSRGFIKTCEGERLINRICRHFRHKVEVAMTQDGGIVRFAEGFCQLEKQSAGIAVECGAYSEGELEDIKHTLIRHLPQFTNDTSVQVNWACQ